MKLWDQTYQTGWEANLIIHIFVDISKWNFKISQSVFWSKKHRLKGKDFLLEEDYKIKIDAMAKDT